MEYIEVNDFKIGLYDFSIQLVIVKDVDDDTIVYANKAAVESTGKTYDALIGAKSVVGWPNAESYRKDDLEIIESGIPRLGYVEHMEVANGGTHFILTNKWPIYKGDKRYIALATVDITALQEKVKDKQTRVGHSIIDNTEKLRCEFRKILETL